MNLLDNLTITSDSALSFNQLNLDNLTLTLGSESSDLQVSSALILDNTNERLITGTADFVSLGSLEISAGDVIFYRWNCFFVRRKSAIRNREYWM